MLSVLWMQIFVLPFQVLAFKLRLFYLFINYATNEEEMKYKYCFVKSVS